MPALWKITLATVAGLHQPRPRRHVDWGPRQHWATLRWAGNHHDITAMGRKHHSAHPNMRILNGEMGNGWQSWNVDSCMVRKRKRGREGGIEQRGGISRTDRGRQAPVSLHSFNSTKQPAYYWQSPYWQLRTAYVCVRARVYECVCFHA